MRTHEKRSNQDASSENANNQDPDGSCQFHEHHPKGSPSFCFYYIGFYNGFSVVFFIPVKFIGGVRSSSVRVGVLVSIVRIMFILGWNVWGVGKVMIFGNGNIRKRSAVGQRSGLELHASANEERETWEIHRNRREIDR